MTLFLAAGSDGSDFLPDVDGAMVDHETLAQAMGLALDTDELIQRNDTYRFHEALGNLIRTGPTNTNVCDFMVYLRGGSVLGLGGRR